MIYIFYFFIPTSGVLAIRMRGSLFNACQKVKLIHKKYKRAKEKTIDVFTLEGNAFRYLAIR
jgi:hypothetical protein